MNRQAEFYRKPDEKFVSKQAENQIVGEDQWPGESHQQAQLKVAEHFSSDRAVSSGPWDDVLLAVLFITGILISLYILGYA